MGLEMNEKMIFHGVVAFALAQFVWEFYLDVRQHFVYLRNTKLPNQLIGVVPQKTFDKARIYALDKSKYNFFVSFFSLFCNMLFLFCNGMFIFWNLGKNIINYFGFETNEILQSIGFLVLLNFLNTIISLPASIYYTFVLEEKHGFNKQTVSFYIWDKIKKHILLQIIVVPLTVGIVYIVKIGGDYFFIYLWIFVTAVTLFLYTIYPDYIAPRFDKYTPLQEGGLKVEIEKLAKSVGFPLYKIYVVEGSKRSAHSNAYFYGLFNNKRIVLFDTLLQNYTSGSPKDQENKKEKKDKNEKDNEDEKVKDEKKGCTDPEVLAVLGHELGHWKLNHIVKNLCIAQVNLLLMFMVFGALFKYDTLYRGFGFYDSKPVIIGLIIILHFISLPYFELLNFFMAILSRSFEFEADHFAKSLGHANNLKSALVKLNSDNLGFPIYDPWYSKWHNSHPPLLERLQALDKED